MHRKRIFAGLVAIGALAALLDGLDAVIYYKAVANVSAHNLFQNIAAALLGRQAFFMGWPTVALGVVLHFGIACTLTVIFYFAARQMRWLGRHPSVAGPVYGLCVYLVMHYLIVPHGRQPHSSHATFWRSELADQLFSHMIFVGLTIALGVRRLLRERNNPK